MVDSSGDPHPTGHQETPCSTASGTWVSLLPTVSQLFHLPGHLYLLFSMTPRGSTTFSLKTSIFKH